MMGPTFHHPGQPEMQAQVILASKSTVAGATPILTIRGRYPRIIHAEGKTHRVITLTGEVIIITEDLSMMDDKNMSRNARSSRAVPVKTMLEEVRTRPFTPWHWGKNQKGMQAGEPLSADEIQMAEYIWDAHRLDTIGRVEALTNMGLHKQIPNRLLEPLSWIDVLFTSTDWDNFLWLRDHADAEPHLQDFARLVKQAIDSAEYQTLEPGRWHLPYITENDRDAVCFDMGAGPNTPLYWELLRKISAAKCARISYKPFDGDASYEREIERYDSLVRADRVHASPIEHQATPDRGCLISSDIFFEEEGDCTPDKTLDARKGYENEALHGNFTGWIQARKLVPNERYVA